jgi:hypothetical protein
MGKIALSQNRSLDGVMQSPGHTDVPSKYRGWAVDRTQVRSQVKPTPRHSPRGEWRGVVVVLLLTKP